MSAACGCVLAAAGCGGSSNTGSTAVVAGGSGGAGALSAEARSAATGDIPDNQVFLMYTSSSPRYSIKYPEGWTRRSSGRDVTFRDKNNIVHVVIGAGPPPTPASVAGALATLKRSTPTLAFTMPRAVRIGRLDAVKASYTTRSAPDPVTGRSVQLTVDRYALYDRGRTAIIDLGTPRGVDNVDAYRMIAESFRWE
jgi:hypothetical protein